MRVSPLSTTTARKSPSAQIRAGDSVPHARLAELDETGAIRAIDSETLFAKGKTIVIGVPGAFTPICTHNHLPEFISNAVQMRAQGYDRIVCLVASDPFATAAWALQLDPAHEVRFVSDGNLEFSRAVGLVSHEEELFLGERSRRYVMTIDNGVVARVRIEPSTMHLTCTRAADVLDFG